MGDHTFCLFQFGCGWQIRQISQILLINCIFGKNSIVTLKVSTQFVDTTVHGCEKISYWTTITFVLLKLSEN